MQVGDSQSRPYGIRLRWIRFKLVDAGIRPYGIRLYWNRFNTGDSRSARH